jgi:large subunit ribosomal protein L2
MLKTTATLGLISNPLKRQVVIGKAGRSRWLNKRPVVRGVAMNPIDHPHGGKTSGGRPSVTPWGKLTKGQPTRKQKFNKFFIK